MCLGKPLDDTLLRVIRSEVRTLSDSLDGIRQKGDEGSKRLDATLDLFKSEFDQAMALFEEKQSRLERSIDELKYSDRLRWDHMESLCKTLEKEVGVMRTRLDEKSSSGDSKLNVFDAPDHNKWFTGREKEVESLEKCLSFGKGNKLKIAAICGLGGCGKTTLAAHVAWKHKHAYEGGVFWVSMEDSDKFENSINDLALRLKLMADSFALTLSKVLTYLSQQRKSWLMVLDNVDQLELSDEMHKILSGRWKRQAAGHLLLTTRREPKEVCECIDLQPSCCVEVFSFSEDEAKRFLVNRRGVCYSTEREKTLNELVRELGCLPLALEQAGAHIKALQCPISKYLDQYRIERLRLLSQHPAKPSWEYESKRRSAVHTTWLLNFEYIKNSAPHGEMASRFVQAAAFLNPDEIQEVLINPEILSAEDPTCQNCNLPLAKHHIVTLLTKFSLFQRKSSRSFRLHRLVQDVIRDGMTINEKAAALIMSFRLLFDAFGSPARTRAYISESTQGHVAVSVGSPSLAHCFKIKCHLTSLLFLELSGIETETLCRTLCTADVYELLIPEVKRELEDRQKQKEERLKELREELPDDTKRLKKEMKHLHEESQKWDEVALALKEERKQVCEEVLSPQQEKRAKEYEQRLSFVEEERKQTEEEMSLLEEDLQLNEKTKKVAKAVISLLNKNITLFEEIRTLFEGEKELMKEILKHSTCFIGRAILSKRRAMLEKNI